MGVFSTLLFFYLAFRWALTKRRKLRQTPVNHLPRVLYALVRKLCLYDFGVWKD